MKQIEQVFGLLFHENIIDVLEVKKKDTIPFYINILK